MVISGHFGGTFFSESGGSGYTLPTELLEEKACQNKCRGILSNVKEVFLFGCNTLASKKPDKRTYQEYLKVLLDDGMARDAAERVVASRYSPLGTPFHARMNFIFSDSSTVYGFNELSPLGKHIRRPLKNYFQFINQKFGSYASYLNGNHYIRSKNQELFDSLPGSSLNQAHISISNEDPEQIDFFLNKCLLYEDTAKFTHRAQALKNIFESGKSGLAFFAIDHFLRRNKKEMVEGAGRKIFRSIRTNESFAKKFTSYYENLKNLPYIKLVYLNVRKKFQWIDTFNLKKHRKKDLLELIETPNREAYISVLLLLSENQIDPGEFYISKNDLPKDYIQNIWSLLILEHLEIEAPDWQFDMLKYCKNNIEKDLRICHQALITVTHTQPSLETAQEVAVLLDYEEEGLIQLTIRVLGQSEIKDYHIHKKIASFLNHKNPWIRLEALETLGLLQSPYEDVQNDMVALLPHANHISELLQPFTNQEIVEKVFWSLSHMDIKAESAQKQIIQYALQRAQNKELVKEAFKSLENTSEFSDFTLSFFYNHLESRDDSEFLFSIVESLSRNEKLKDLGIHYRFLLFQQEESSKFKQEILKRMSPLTWLHPETQISFLNYIRNPDPTVRNLAINILRNINNLQPDTLKQIKTLYEEENIKELKGFFSSL